MKRVLNLTYDSYDKGAFQNEAATAWLAAETTALREAEAAAETAAPERPPGNFIQATPDMVSRVASCGDCSISVFGQFASFAAGEGSSFNNSAVAEGGVPAHDNAVLTVLSTAEEPATTQAPSPARPYYGPGPDMPFDPLHSEDLESMD